MEIVSFSQQSLREKKKMKRNDSWVSFQIPAKILSCLRILWNATRDL